MTVRIPLDDPGAFVGKVVASVRAPRRLREDLIAAGYESLVRVVAVWRSRPFAGTFALFAWRRVRYDVLDEWRRIKALNGMGRFVPRERWPRWVDVDHPQVQGELRDLSAEGVPDQIDAVEAVRRLWCLTERQRLVLLMYYFDDFTLRDIGRCLGVTESRASQLHTGALRELRATLGEAAA